MKKTFGTLIILFLIAIIFWGTTGALDPKSCQVRGCTNEIGKEHDFMDDWDGYMPDGSDAEDYWENW